ncbi:hypothetical protein JK361_15200 [Streptomyces sp. 5-8]|uniref:Uncharacterized protein n=1 Tax=Streptomyces musisoli TaxID=2802280 RepID=A0ABS1P0N9_9ACTN|nr:MULTISPECIES: hypothetical protein [Streptomyces]MBL1105918.1 hypothetical protein [Streptomyces musisoli]MBY8841806.1 hypothetical protein [Streptomyces sp. SP2-10]
MTDRSFGMGERVAECDSEHAPGECTAHAHPASAASPINGKQLIEFLNYAEIGGTSACHNPAMTRWRQGVLR